MSSKYSVQNIKTNHRPAFSNRSFQGNLVSRAQQPISTSFFTTMSSAVRGATSGLAGLNNDALVNNEKQTMQNLNDRLASYLEKVRALEEANYQLERQIQDRLIQRIPVTVDFDSKYSEAAALAEQIKKVTIKNAELLLDIGNAKLTADDYRQKCEIEAHITQTIERDILNLKKQKNDHENYILTLKIQLEDLQNELAFLKSNHTEELSSVKDLVTSKKVNVEVDSIPGQDLTEAINEVRMQYEKYAQKNKAETDEWYTIQLQGLSEEVKKNTEAVRNAKEEITDKRRIAQSLEIELESLRSQVHVLNGNLEQTNHSYADNIGNVQRSIISVQEHLREITDSMKQQKQEYEFLLRIKENLEAEIIVYRRLLEGEDELMKVSALKESNIAFQQASAQIKSELGSTARLQSSTQNDVKKKSAAAYSSSALEKSAEGASTPQNSSSMQDKSAKTSATQLSSQMTLTSTSTSIQQASSAPNSSAAGSITATQKSTVTQDNAADGSSKIINSSSTQDKSVDGASKNITSSSTLDKSVDGSSKIITSSSTLVKPAGGSSTTIMLSSTQDKSADGLSTIKSSSTQDKLADGSTKNIKLSSIQENSSSGSKTTQLSSTQENSASGSEMMQHSSCTQGELMNGSIKTMVEKATTQQMTSSQEKSASGSKAIQESSATQKESLNGLTTTQQWSSPKEINGQTSGKIEVSATLLTKYEPDVRIRKTVQVITQTMVDGKLISETTEVQSFEEVKK